MPRKLRVEYEGAIYHVMNRGDRREPIFLGDAGHELFLQTLSEACRKTGWQVHAAVPDVQSFSSGARNRQDNAAGRRQLEEAMEQRKELERSRESGDWKRLRRGWCWGSKEFRDEMLEWIGQKQGGQHYGEELKESDEQKAERLAVEMLRKAKWSEEDLKRRRKSDPKKARMAAKLRLETAMTWQWIAERLAMGHWRTAANAVRLRTSKE